MASEPNPEFYMFKGRDSTESSRLNLQDRIVLRLINGHYIHPRIPKNSLLRIADVGTGTGQWLEGLREQFHSIDSSVQRQFDGFDISPAQFPGEPGPGCCYKVQDMLQPFPEEFHEKYDLVHIRFVLVAFKVDQYVTVAKNLIQLLKPGGYIQWDELDLASVSTASASPILTNLMELIYPSLEHAQISVTASLTAAEALKTVGITDIYREERNSWWISGMDDDLRASARLAVKVLATQAFLFAGKATDKESAEALVEEDLQEFDREKGYEPPNFPFRSVTGKQLL